MLPREGLRSIARVAGLAILAIPGGACASLTGHPVMFNGEQSGYETDQTPAVYVLPNSTKMEHSLDVDARSTVQKSLAKMGYAAASEGKAGIFLVVEAWVDTKTQRSIASMFRPATVEVIRDATGATRTVRRPERALSIPVTTEIRFPRMTMVALDAAHFRSTGQTKVLWRGDTLLQNSELRLEDALPYLLTPLLTSFGTQSRGPVKVEVSRQTAMEFK